MTTTIPVRLRRLVPAALFSATAALGLVASPATVSAEPVWDIEEFDNCTAALDDGMENTMHWIETATEYCCMKSGGVWNDSEKTCGAPPAEGEGAALPPKVPVEGPIVPVQPPIVAPPNDPPKGPADGAVEPVLPPTAG